MGYAKRAFVHWYVGEGMKKENSAKLVKILQLWRKITKKLDVNHLVMVKRNMKMKIWVSIRQNRVLCSVFRTIVAIYKYRFRLQCPEPPTLFPFQLFPHKKKFVPFLILLIYLKNKGSNF